MNSLLKFITCGSVDDGKSTLIGHILYDSKLLYADQEKALELDSKVGSREGEIDYSLLLDGLMAEREQGITIDVAYRYFTTNARSFIVADTPGHEEYTRNMAVGASFADLSIILINAKEGVLVQTRRHARICSLMGIKHFVFAVNKIDLVDYSEQRFNEVVAQIDELVKELSLENVKIIPVSATVGDNVTTRSENTPWYDGGSLLEYLEGINVSETAEKGFYMPIQRVCRPNHTFRGFQGQIESGSVAVDDEIITYPSNEKAKVKSILVTDKDADTAKVGQPVTIQLDREVDVSRGCVFAKSADISLTNSFETTLLWMDEQELHVGKEYFVKLGTKLLIGTVEKLDYKIDVNTGKHERSENLTKNEIGRVSITVSQVIAVDLFEHHKTLGELILIDRVTNMTAACGVVDLVNDIAKEKISYAFENGDLKARGDIFEEYYYNVDSKNISKKKQSGVVYKIGDALPLKGESYEYPENVDILVIRDNIAITVRDSKVLDILSLENYNYNGISLINGRGFEIKAKSQQEVEAFLNEEKKLNNSQMAEFMNKWIAFDTYRKVVFTDEYIGVL